MMCPSGATCLSICELVFFSEHYKNQAKRVGLVQSGHHLIEYDLFSS
jgi:hypothetical protein